MAGPKRAGNDDGKDMGMDDDAPNTGRGFKREGKPLPPLFPVRLAIGLFCEIIQ